MLDEFIAQNGGGRGYNEVIVSDAVWHDTLPYSFDAWFYPATSECHANDECEARTRRAYATFQLQYQPAASAVPLLALDPANWEAPFSVAPPDE